MTPNQYAALLALAEGPRAPGEDRRLAFTLGTLAGKGLAECALRSGAETFWITRRGLASLAQSAADRAAGR